MPSLPPELLLHIFRDAAGDDKKLDYATLRHLCLTSRALLPLARKQLYRRADFVLVRNPAPEQVTCDDGTTDDDWEDTLMLDNQCSGASLVKWPHLAPFVRAIKIEHNEDDLGSSNVESLTRKAVTACAGLQSLELTGGRHWELADLVADALLAGSPTLETLSVPMASFSKHHTPPLVRLLQAQTTLKHLTFQPLDDGDAAWAWRGDQPFPPFLFSLSTFTELGLNSHLSSTRFNNLMATRSPLFVDSS